mgnify:CR=1 FL=1
MKNARYLKNNPLLKLVTVLLLGLCLIPFAIGSPVESLCILGLAGSMNMLDLSKANDSDVIKPIIEEAVGAFPEATSIATNQLGAGELSYQTLTRDGYPSVSFHDMGAGLTALIVGLQPVITAIWLSARGGHVSRRQWQGLALGFVGLAMVVSRKLEGGIEVTPWSLTMILMALVSITTGTLYQKRFVQPCDVRSANAVQLMAAYVVTLPLALMEAEPALWNAEMSWALAWSVLALTLGGSSLFYILIQRGAAASVTSLMYLVPPTTAVMAWILFNEPITLVTLAGIAVTAVGVSLVVRPASTR